MNDHSASATHDNRVCIIGCGRIGMASAYALIQSSFIRELVLVGRDRERTEGEVMDLEHAVAVPMKSPIIELDLDEEERKALHRSAETLRRLNPRLSAGAA